LRCSVERLFAGVAQRSEVVCLDIHAEKVAVLNRKESPVEGAKVLVMGLAFKENCPDLRNTRVIDVVAELKDYNCDVDVYDP
jgi:UDP-N-acetyl-D-galactosamine dehydrogenase